MEEGHSNTTGPTPAISVKMSPIAVKVLQVCFIVAVIGVGLWLLTRKNRFVKRPGESRARDGNSGRRVHVPKRPYESSLHVCDDRNATRSKFFGDRRMDAAGDLVAGPPVVTDWNVTGQASAEGRSVASGHFIVKTMNEVKEAGFAKRKEVSSCTLTDEDTNSVGISRSGHTGVAKGVVWTSNQRPNCNSRPVLYAALPIESTCVQPYKQQLAQKPLNSTDMSSVHISS